MSKPALILVHPGSLAAHGGSQALEAAVREMEQHEGPLVVIDGAMSDGIAPYDRRIEAALKAAENKGEFAARLWGCDAGEHPFPAWSGYAPEGSSIELIHEDQQDAAAAIVEVMKARDVLLSGAWASYENEGHGCVNSVREALKEAGWTGESAYSENVLFEEDFDM